MTNNKPKIAVITGAGVSAESGISTFRDSNGLWENHRIEDVATPQAWKKNPQLVLEFYNLRRKQLQSVSPNKAHFKLAEWEKYFDLHIITQNVDDLHERAGSSQVTHLHGELLKARSESNIDYVIQHNEDIIYGQCCPDGHQMRPHIVWFGESVPLIEAAVEIIQSSEIIIVIGTSLQVYPAAGLVSMANQNIPLYYLDPNPNLEQSLWPSKKLVTIKNTAVNGIEILENYLLPHKS